MLHNLEWISKSSCFNLAYINSLKDSAPSYICLEADQTLNAVCCYTVQKASPRYHNSPKITGLLRTNFSLSLCANFHSFNTISLSNIFPNINRTSQLHRSSVSALVQRSRFDSYWINLMLDEVIRQCFQNFNRYTCRKGTFKKA